MFCTKSSKLSTVGQVNASITKRTLCIKNNNVRYYFILSVRFEEKHDKIIYFAKEA